MFKAKTKKLMLKMRFDAWQNWEYKHTFALLGSLFVFILLLDTTLFTVAMDTIIKLGYFGAFLAGIMFPSTFTFVPATTAIVLLAGTELNPVVVALTAASGAMIGDYLILRFVEEKVAYELKPIAARLGIPSLISYLQYRRQTNWLVRVLGAVIVASPGPDEIGIGMMGVSRISRKWFLVICYMLNAGGILSLVLLGKAVL